MNYLKGKAFVEYRFNNKAVNTLFESAFKHYLALGLNRRKAESKALDECYLVTPTAEKGKAFASCYWCGNEITQGDSLANEAGKYFHYDERKKEKCCFMVYRNSLEFEETQAQGEDEKE